MGRAIGSNSTRCWRACSGSLLVVALLVVAQGVSASNVEQSDADRIARLRDQANKESAATAPIDTDQASAPAVAPKVADEDAQASAEEEKPLPPKELLLLGTSDGGLFGRDSGAQRDTKQMGDGWLFSTLAALGVVLALVFGLRWLLRRGGIVTASVPQGSVVEVLSRTTIAPRSHVILMRVGQRILVVNDSSNGMRTLSTIDDPEELADLLGAVDAARPSSMTKSFSGVMGKLSNHWSATEAELDSDPAVEHLEDGVTMDRTRGALSSVRGRLAALSGGGVKA